MIELPFKAEESSYGIGIGYANDPITGYAEKRYTGLIIPISIPTAISPRSSTEMAGPEPGQTAPSINTRAKKESGEQTEKTTV